MSKSEIISRPPASISPASPPKDPGTCATVPRHIWTHNVEIAAGRLGATAETLRDREVRAMLGRWYNAGEPIWMAAEGLATISRERAKTSFDTLAELRGSLAASFMARIRRGRSEA